MDQQKNEGRNLETRSDHPQAIDVPHTGRSPAPPAYSKPRAVLVGQGIRFIQGRFIGTRDGRGGRWTP
jgi:hypothetical protein